MPRSSGPLAGWVLGLGIRRRDLESVELLAQRSRPGPAAGRWAGLLLTAGPLVLAFGLLALLLVSLLAS